MKQYAMLLLMLAMLGFARPTSHQFYMSIKGTKQGDFKGEASPKEKEGWFKVISFDLQSEVPVDVSRGGAAADGKREHKPIVITKEIDAASPKLFQASSTGEVLSSVLLETVDEHDKVIETIKLENAMIDGIRKMGGSGAPRETITMRYSQITLKRGTF